MGSSDFVFSGEQRELYELLMKRWLSAKLGAPLVEWFPLRKPWVSIPALDTLDRIAHTGNPSTKEKETGNLKFRKSSVGCIAS